LLKRPWEAAEDWKGDVSVCKVKLRRWKLVDGDDVGTVQDYELVQSHAGRPCPSDDSEHKYCMGKPEVSELRSTYSSPLALRARLRNTLCFLQTSTAGASCGSPTTSKRVAKLIGELAARLVDFLAALEHASAVLPCLSWCGHCEVAAVGRVMCL
jgi:hypothetical protein